MAWRGRGTALKFTDVAQFKIYLQGLSFSNWKPSGMTLHNTAEPSRKRWDAYPGEQWLRNLKSYYQGKGWPAGPHAFIDGNAIWVMTDFNVRGVHSPSWNGTRLGIEMVADFNKEDDETGIGLKVKKQTAALFAVCHEVFGWEPSNTSIKLHKEDPATDHDCPGKYINKVEFIRMVIGYMGDAGDHVPAPPVSDPTTPPLPTPKPPEETQAATVDVAGGDTLNIRETASAGSRALLEVVDGTAISVIGEAMNGATKWYRVLVGGQQGWAAAQYVTLGTPSPKIKHTNITATVFGGAGDLQASAYGGRVDGNKPGVSFPYKWRGRLPPSVKVRGPRGEGVFPVVDVGPWNTDNPEYVLNGARPAAEKQRATRSRAQNGMVPTNDAGIDLTPAAAHIVGIEGKGKVSWEFE